MADKRLTCPKCSHEMERGHVPDAGYGQVYQARWSRGDPERQRFLGGIKWKRADQVPLVAYRCTSCGFVELYAAPLT